MDSLTRSARMLLAPLLLAGALAAPAPAAADISSLLGSCQARDALDDDTRNGSELPFHFCDDGVPAVGGTTPNVGAASAVAVPAAYTGAGQPQKDVAASLAVPGNSLGDVALDVDLSVPDPVRYPVPAGGYPLVVMMHGCCAGSKADWEGATIDPGGKENWHYNNAWFASRGYVVANYTARGFVNGSGRGSTGETQLNSDRFEINDYQHLAGQLADRGDLNAATPQAETIDPGRVVPTGGSYGGGFSWLALTDPTWFSPNGKPMRVVAVAAKYGWTNLLESLVPSGFDMRDSLPTPFPAEAAQPIGVPKRSIIAALYGSGKFGIPPGSPHATFPPDIDEAQACLASFDPFEQNPLCANTVARTLPRFLTERSAYFANGFFAGLTNGSVDPVPVFSAGTFTDQLFPAPEHRRMVERLKIVRPGYPVQEYYGDYNHFVQNKRKEWADLCGADHHPCGYGDYPAGSPLRDLNANPVSLARENGVTTRLNRFIDHYARPPGNPGAPRPAFDVTAALQACPQNAAGLGVPGDEPGPRLTATSFGELAPERLTVNAVGPQVTTNMAGANPHAKTADPVGNLIVNGGACPAEKSAGFIANAGPGVATYDSNDLPSAFTMLGSTRAVVTHTGTGSSVQLNARLYDIAPDGTQLLVDRGVKRLPSPTGVTTIDLHGAGWRFPKGHRLRLELAQDDDPYVKSSVVPSYLVVQGVNVSMPVRERSTTVGGFPLPPPNGRRPRITVRTPRLASDAGRGGRFPIVIRARPGTARRNVIAYRLQIRDATSKTSRVVARSTQRRRFSFRGRRGHTYLIRARGVDRSGQIGPAASSRTVVPFDDARKLTRAVRYSGGWKRLRSRSAFARGLSVSSRRGARIDFRFRGDRLYLVGRVGPRGGKALVVLNGRYGTISFYGRRTRARRVVGIFRGKRRGVNRLRVVNLGRKGSPRGSGTLMEIDALGTRRR